MKFMKLFTEDQMSEVTSEFSKVITTGEKEAVRVVNTVLKNTLTHKNFIAKAIEENRPDAMEYAKALITAPPVTTVDDVTPVPPDTPTNSVTPTTPIAPVNADPVVTLAFISPYIEMSNVVVPKETIDNNMVEHLLPIEIPEDEECPEVLPEIQNDTMLVPIDSIKVGGNRRRINYQKVLELASSIKEIGLINPITITSDNTLIAGNHRLEVYRKLGLQEIPCIIMKVDALQADLAQIDENLIHNGLTELEIGEALQKREEILARLNLRAKRGQNQHTGGSANLAPPLRTSKNLAVEMDMSERSMQRKKQIANNICQDARNLLRNTEIADHQSMLEKIGSLNHEDQRKVAQKILNSNYRESKLKVARQVIKDIEEEEYLFVNPEEELVAVKIGKAAYDRVLEFAKYKKTTVRDVIEDSLARRPM